VHIIDGGQELPRRITRSRGFIIVHPDTLVSATRVADAVRCPRKPVLQEKVRSTSSSTPSLVYGNILHSVLQRCLVADRWDCTFRARAIDDILAKSLEGLWECNLELNVARAELLEHSQAMEPWAARYVQELVTVRPAYIFVQDTADTLARILLTSSILAAAGINRPARPSARCSTSKRTSSRRASA
jgi:DNA replication ATP-dependent helicase Dna2